MKIDCAHCGAALDRFPSQVAKNPRQFCDRRCMGAHRSRQVDVVCAVCGKTWTVKASRADQNDSITCGPACLAAYRQRAQLTRWGSGERRSATCDQCGKAIERKPSQLAKYPTNFCSRSCAGAFRLGKGEARTGSWCPCTVCGKDVWRTPATTLAHVLCGMRCAGRLNADLRRGRVIFAPRFGPDHHNWKGGVSPYGPGFGRGLSKRIRQRDGDRCRACGTPPRWPGDLVAHHIDEQKVDHDPSNLITVCRSCHLLIHYHKVPCPVP